MLDKCGEGTRYIYRKQLKCALVPNNAFSVASAKRDERESRPGGETNSLVSSCYQTLLIGSEVVLQDIQLLLIVTHTAPLKGPISSILVVLFTS